MIQKEKLTLHALSLLIFIFVISCGGHKSVMVRHFFLDSPEKEVRHKTISSIYLQIKKSDYVETVTNTPLSPADVHDILNPGEIAGRLSASLGHYDGGISAWRSVDQFEEKDPFIEGINPTGLLQLEIWQPQAWHKKSKRKETEGSGDTIKEYTIETKTYACEVHGRFTFYSLPDRKKVEGGKVSGIIKRSYEKSEVTKGSGNFLDHLSSALGALEKDSATRMVQVINDAYGDLLGSVARELNVANIVQRNRRIYINNADKKPYEAFRLLKRERYDKSESIWKKQVGKSSGSWKTQWNLAVAAEKKRDYDEALRRYEAVMAQATAADPELTPTFQAIFADLERTHRKWRTPKTSASTSGWFNAVTAVLPLSDEVVSLDGPDIVRKNIHDFLTGGGYNTLPLEQIDETLRTHGFSDAGQFGATTREKLAAWLGADRLVMGHITDYDGINLGVYQSNRVGGNILIWDATTGREIWNIEKKVKFKRYANDDDHALRQFIMNLGRTIMNRIDETPLAAEAAEFSRQSLEGLPFKR